MHERHCEVLKKIVHIADFSPSNIETDECAETRAILRKVLKIEQPDHEEFGCQSADECGQQSCLWCPRVQREIARMEKRGFECGAMMELAIITQRKPTKKDYIDHMVSASAYRDHAPKRVGFLEKLFRRKR